MDSGGMTLMESRFLSVVGGYQKKMQSDSVTEADRDLLIRGVLAVAQVSAGLHLSKRLFSITGWEYKWIWEVERGPFRSFKLTLRRELKRWL